MVSKKDQTNDKKDLNQSEVREVLNEGPKRVGRGRTAVEKREDYRRYYEMKKKIIEFEEKNTRYIVLWPASDAKVRGEDKFYNMGGTSAVIYIHELCPRINRKATLRRDMEHGDARFAMGICSVRNIAKLTELLAEIGIKRDEDMTIGDDENDLIFYKLNREYGRTEVKEMLKQEQDRLDEVNRLLYSEVLFPDIHKRILELKKIIPTKLKNMDKGYRSLVADPIMMELMNLTHLYSMMAHGDLELLDAAEKMRIEVDKLQADVSMLNELRVWEVSTCARVAISLGEIKRLIKGKIINKAEQK